MKKTILICNSSYYPNIIGGAEISTQILAESLVEHFNVYVLTTGPQSRRKGIVKDKINNVTVLRLPANNIYWPFDSKQRGIFEKTIWHSFNMFNPLQFVEIKKVIQDINPSIIHSQNLSGLSFALWKAASDFNIPIVHTLRDYSLISPVKMKLHNRIYLELARKYSKNISSVIGISNYILQKHLDEELFHKVDQHLISNVVTNNRSNLINKPFKKPLSIGFFGQITSIKGVELLIDAIKMIPKEIVSELFIVGDGPLRDSLERTNTDSRIRFTGKLTSDAVNKYMKEVDLTFVPSLWGEPFGRVVIESYQAGTPVFATRDGGIPEIIYKPERFLLRDKTSSSIVDAINYYYNLDGEVRNNYRKECFDYSKNFSPYVSLTKHMDIYENLMN